MCRCIQRREVKQLTWVSQNDVNVNGTLALSLSTLSSTYITCTTLCVLVLFVTYYNLGAVNDNVRSNSLTPLTDSVRRPQNRRRHDATRRSAESRGSNVRSDLGCRHRGNYQTTHVVGRWTTWSSTEPQGYRSQPSHSLTTYCLLWCIDWLSSVRKKNDCWLLKQNTLWHRWRHDLYSSCSHICLFWSLDFDILTRDFRVLSRLINILTKSEVPVAVH